MIQVYKQTSREYITTDQFTKDITDAKIGGGEATMTTRRKDNSIEIKINGTVPGEPSTSMVYYKLLTEEPIHLTSATNESLHVDSTLACDRSGVGFGIAIRNSSGTIQVSRPANGSKVCFRAEENTDIYPIIAVATGAVVDNVSLTITGYHYKKAIAAEDITSNGDMALMPSEATVHAVLNGEWEATLEHPIDEEGRWKYLEEDNIVKMPSFNGDQLFRIKNTVKADSGVSCEMEPIFYDAAGDCWLEDVRPTEKNGLDALNIMLASNTKYKAISNITKKSTSYFENKNFLEALNGDIDNSFINRWGGEIMFDNYSVIVNDRVGDDKGVSLLYGKNLKQDGISEEVDIRDVVTRIYPKGYNGCSVTGYYLDSPLKSNYPTIHTATVTFDKVKMADDASEDEDDDVIICKNEDQLRNAFLTKCKEQWELGIDKPKVTIEADMVLLQNAEGYEEFKNLETVGFGDTVHCKHSKLGITTDVRVIEIYYDSILDRTQSVVLGDFQYNYLKNVSSKISKISEIEDKVDGAIDDGGEVIAERIKGFINGSKAQLSAQYDVAEKVDVVAILFENLDKTSSLYGALGIGTQGLMVSKTRLSDDSGWDWTTSITSSGIIADTIVAGLLSDKTGKNYWDLDKGTFVCNSGTFAGNLSAAGGTFSGNLSAAGGTFKGTINASKGSIGGWTITNDDITAGDTQLRSDGSLKFGQTTLSADTLIAQTGKKKEILRVNKGVFFCEKDNGVENPIDIRFGTLPVSSGGIALYNEQVLYGNETILVELTQSSKRFKDIERDMTAEDVEELYKIQPVIAKYKDEYLSNPEDERYQKYMPMFIAEDVDEHFSICAQHGKGGTVDDWNYRIMIPAMFQMIKSQKAEIDKLKAEVEALKGDKK